MIDDKPMFICTIGKNNNRKDIIQKMYNHGMRYIRFNMSYRLDYYDDVVKYVHELNDELGINIGIICDLAGTEMRVITDKEIEVHNEQQVIIGDDIKLDQGNLSLLKKGEQILIKDGKIILEVEKYENGKLYCKSLSNNVITVNANCYNKTLYDNLPFISEKDEINLIDAIRYKADFVAVSHVRNKQNINEVKKYLLKRQVNTKIMSKIENLQAIENLDEIIDSSDSIMIARGDLGKILPFTDIAYNQKLITKKVLKAGKMLVSATDYLFSLLTPTIPSRAEIVDLFTAYEDGINTIMFTKEIAHTTAPEYLLDVANKVYESYKKYVGGKND